MKILGRILEIKASDFDGRESFVQEEEAIGGFFDVFEERKVMASKRGMHEPVFACRTKKILQFAIIICRYILHVDLGTGKVLDRKSVV